MNVRRCQRALTIVGAALVSALALTACGSSSGAGDAHVKLTVWQTQGGCDSSPVLCDLETAYTAAHPDVTFSNVTQPFENYTTLLKTANISKSGPDIAWVQSGSWVLENQAYLEDISDLLPQSERNLFPGSLQYLSKNYTLSDGLMAAPYVSDAYVGYYHPSLFAKAGIAQPPTTWNQLYADCSALHKIGVTPIVYGDEGLGTPQFYTAQDLSYLLAGVLSPDEVGQLAQGKLSWTDPRIEQQLAKWQHLSQIGCTNDNLLTESAAPARFLRKESAIIDVVSPGPFKANQLTDVKILPMPFNDTPKKTFVLMGGGGWAATNYGKHIDATKAFLGFIMSAQGQQVVAKSKNPARTGTPLPTGAYPTEQQINNYGGQAGVTAYPYIDNILPVDVWNTVQSVLPSVLAGKISPSDALNKVEDSAKHSQ